MAAPRPLLLRPRHATVDVLPRLEDHLLWSGKCTQGYVLAGLSALLSATAAVYTEWALKRNADSLYWQNMQLYSYGFLCNAVGLTLTDVASKGKPAGPHACI